MVLVGGEMLGTDMAMNGRANMIVHITQMVKGAKRRYRAWRHPRHQ